MSPQDKNKVLQPANNQLSPKLSSPAFSLLCLLVSCITYMLYYLNP